MPKTDANFWNYDVWQGEYARIKEFCKFDIAKIGKKFKPCLLFYEIKWTERRTHYIYELLQETPKCALKVCFQALKVLVTLTSETDETLILLIFRIFMLPREWKYNIAKSTKLPERKGNLALTFVFFFFSSQNAASGFYSEGH